MNKVKVVGLRVVSMSSVTTPYEAVIFVKMQDCDLFDFGYVARCYSETLLTCQCTCGVLQVRFFIQVSI
jgi:hypothetical protein